MRKKGLLISLIVTIIAILIIFAGYMHETGDREGYKVENNLVELLVSRNFFADILSDKKVQVTPNDTVLDLISKNLDVEVQAGGFVKSINKISPSKINGFDNYWFYYINGVAADVGADKYILSPGDKVYWDYHPWVNDVFIYAIVGAYPEPFVNGYRNGTKKVVIVSSEGSKNEAERLAISLKTRGVKNVEVKGLRESQIANPTQPTIVVGVWNELEKQPDLKRISSQMAKEGLFVNINSNKFKLLDFKGKEVESYDKDIGIITATASRLGEPNPLWLVVSIDKEGLKKTVELLDKNPEKIRGFYGAAVVKGEVKRLPLSPVR